MAIGHRKRAASPISAAGSDADVTATTTKKAKKNSSNDSAAKGGDKGGEVKAGQKDDDGNLYWEISNARRVTVSSFKGIAMVGVREFYQKDGKALPGKKGISMTVEQFSALVRVLPEIEAALSEQDVQLPRPVYEGQPEVAMNEADEDEKATTGSKKKNFEETSDEEE